MKYDVEKIKAGNPIVPLIERYVPLKKSGGKVVGCCPFHEEKSGSFYVFDRTQHYHCFGCAAHGDVITFVQAMSGLSFQDALKSLAEGVNFEATVRREVKIDTAPLNIEPQWRKLCEATDGRVVDEHAASLGVSPYGLISLGIAWSERQHSFCYPQRNEAGKIVGLRFRNKLGHKWSLEGGKNGLFIPEGTPTRTVTLAEGPTDTAALLSMGIYAVGRPSATSGDELVLAFLAANKTERVIIVADRDANNVGIAGAWRLHEKLPVPSRIFMPQQKDIREAYRAGLTKAELLNEIKRRNG